MLNNTKKTKNVIYKSFIQKNKKEVKQNAVKTKSQEKTSKVLIKSITPKISPLSSPFRKNDNQSFIQLN